MAGESLEIVCTACGAETLVRRETVYDGFVKKGERFLCLSCGHAYPDRASVPFKTRRTAAIFTEADRVRKPEVFASDEARNCRRCRHYVVNPFTQRCGLNWKIVQATDTCGKFEPAQEKTETEPEA
jgi:hypothetical protein